MLCRGSPPTVDAVAHVGKVYDARSPDSGARRFPGTPAGADAAQPVATTAIPDPSVSERRANGLLAGLSTPSAQFAGARVRQRRGQGVMLAYVAANGSTTAGALPAYGT